MQSCVLSSRGLTSCAPSSASVGPIVDSDAPDGLKVSCSGSHNIHIGGACVEQKTLRIKEKATLAEAEELCESKGVYIPKTLDDEAAFRAAMDKYVRRNSHKQRHTSNERSTFLAI